MVELSKYSILIDLKYDGKFLLVHGLYGFVDIIGRAAAQQIYRWQAEHNEVDYHNIDHDLYAFLAKRKHIKNEAEEQKTRSALEKKLLSSHSDKIAHPKMATFIPSYHCNFVCPYCFERDVNRNSPILSKSQVDTAFSMYPDGIIPFIRFYGGEPLLPEHREIIGYILEKAGGSTTFAVVTNGYYLEEFLPLFEGTRVHNFQVTFDGERNMHDTSRVLQGSKGTFDKILRGVEKAIRAGISIRIRMNLSKDNQESCFRLKEWLTEYLEAKDSLVFDLQGLFQYQAEDNKEITEQILEKSLSGSPNVLLRTMPRLARFLYDGTPIKPIISACEYGDGDRIFDPYGDIYSCYLGVGDKRKRIGTYFPEKKLFTNNMLERNALKIEECRKCRFLFLCGGGCPNPIIEEDQNCNEPSCFTMHNLIENFLPSIYRWKKDHGML